MSEPGASRLDFPKLSRMFREALLGYELMPNELKLGQIFCLETFDVGRAVGLVALREWAAWLGLRDSKGLRPDKCAALVNTLNSLGIVDVNCAQGTFEPRPDASLWSRTRAFRVRAFSTETGGSAELPLRAQRELPEALSELARDNAQTQGVGEIRRHLSSEKSADVSPNIRSLTFKRFNVETNKRLERCTPDRHGPSEKSAGASRTGDSEGASTKAIWQRVREFVGEADFRAHWEKAGYLWSNPERVALLEGSLNYVAAGLKSGEIIIKTTRGATLWSTSQIHWRQHNQAVAGGEE